MIPMRRTVLLSVATVLAATPLLSGPAYGAPPRGACSSPEPAHPVIREQPWAQQLLNPQQVWPYSTGAGVTVAVIDSGVDADHPQLRRPGKVLRGRDFFLVGKLPGNYDCVSHGTAVASIIAADPAQGVGFHGVAPGVRILPVRVSDRDLTDSGAERQIDPAVLAKGIRYAVDQGASVLNLSLAGAQNLAPVRSAIAYAVAKNVVVIAAVGNRQQNPQDRLPSYPASYPGVLGVGAVDIAGARLTGSQTGPYVDLVAPGGSVLGATRRGGHSYAQGTSFAAPFVSATAALVRAAWPRLTAAQVVQRLTATATLARGGRGSIEYGAGIVDPFRAVTEGMAAAPARAMPRMHQPPPDPAQLTAAAWWHQTGRDAKSMAVLILGAVVAMVLLSAVLFAGHRRRWAAVRSTVIRTVPATAEPSPEHLLPPSTG